MWEGRRAKENPRLARLDERCSRPQNSLALVFPLLSFPAVFFFSSRTAGRWKGSVINGESVDQWDPRRIAEVESGNTCDNEEYRIETHWLVSFVLVFSWFVILPFSNYSLFGYIHIYGVNIKNLKKILFISFNTIKDSYRDECHALFYSPMSQNRKNWPYKT